MCKLPITILLVVSLLQAGCSLAPSAANRSYKAFNSGEYQESLRLVNRAISTYEYSAEDKANLLFLKAENYAKLQQSSNAIGVLLYIVKTYPESEASFRSKSLLSTLKAAYKKQPSKNIKKNNNGVVKT